MKEPGLSTRTKQLLNKYGLRPKKRFGQNFLVDDQVIRKIIQAAELTGDDLVVEIGPGLGVLTGRLAESAGKVLAIEVDSQLLPALRENLAGFANVEVINQDILKINLDRLVREYCGEGICKCKVVANLPYYITTPIVMHLLESRFNLERLVVMVQKEVGLRMQADPGTKDFGALSVAVQYYSQAEIVTRVPGSAFIPAPEVESVVLRLLVREQPAVRTVDEGLFFKVVKAAFGQRRKTLSNALTGTFSAYKKAELVDLLLKCGIDPRRRGEELSLKEFAAIANALGRTK